MKLTRLLGFILALALLLTLSSFPTNVARAVSGFDMYVGRADRTDEGSLTYARTELIKGYSGRNDAYYFFVPSYWDTDGLRLFIEGTESVTIDDVTYKSGETLSLPVDTAMVLKAKGYRMNLQVKKLSDLPTFFITMASGSDDYINQSKTNKDDADLLIVNPDGTVEFDGALSYIRTRGNSTMKYPKKAYQIKFDKKISLYGMEEDKTFILLANFLDITGLRNTISYDIARYSGAYAYVPDTQSVNVYMNNDYRGLYLLTEKAEIGENRLDITDLEKALEKANEIDLADTKKVSQMKGGQAIRKYYEIPSEPEDYTGGYIITSIQPTFYVKEASGFITARGYHFTFQQPKYVTKAQIDYASALYQSIEDALFSADGIDPATGKHFSEIVDMNSFVNRYLQAEVTNDNDSQFFYTYKDSDSVDPIVYFGPVWDQDNTFGISVLTARAQKLRMKNDQSASYYWFTRATKHDFFNNQLITTYNEIYAPALDILLGNAVDPKGRLKSIDEYAEAIRSSAECDLIRYTLTNRKTYWSNMQTSMGGTYEGNLNYLKKFISERKQALDAAYSPDNLVW